MKKTNLVLAFMLIILAINTVILGADYGSIYITNNSTTQTTSSTSGQWQDITNFSDMVTPSGCTSTVHGITTGASVGDKQYLIRYSLSFYGAAGLWEFGVKIGSDAARGIIERRISSDTDVGNAAGSFIATIPQGIEIGLQIAVDLSSASFTPVHSQLIVVELSESTTPKYGEMNIVNNSIAQASITSFTNLANFNSTYANLDGWSYGTNTLTASSGSAGTYLAILSVSFNGATETNYEIGISKGGNVPYGGSSDTEIVLKRTLGSDNDVGNGGTCGIISISENDDISVQVESSGNSITAAYASIILVRIDGSTTPPYAGMRVDNNSNTISLPQSSWVPESNFSSDILHNSYWDFTASATIDKLTPKGLSAGYYLVNYYLSLSVSTGNDAKTFNTLTAIFNNGSQLLDLTTKRTLEKKQTAGNNPDVAAINGTAIIAIQNPEDAFFMQLQNIDQVVDMDPVIRYANVNLFRIKTLNDGVLPITLSSFTSGFENNLPTLYWITQSETDNMGFNVYRSISQNLGQSILLNVNGLIEGAGNSTEPTDYTFVDMYGVEENFTYYYWIESVDNAGEIETFGPVSLTIPLGGANQGTPITPDSYGLQQNYPNPFNPSTSISFALQEDSNVELIIYNIIGRKIRSIFNDHILADQVYTVVWDGKDTDGKEVSSGVYFYKLITDTKEYTNKMLMVK